MLETERVTEIVDLDLTLLEGEVVEDGEVRFSVKELLVDIQHSIRDLGRANKEDLANLEARIAEKIGVMEHRTKDLEGKVDDLRISRAQLYGVCIGLSLAAGGISGLIAKTIGG